MFYMPYNERGIKILKGDKTMKKIEIIKAVGGLVISVGVGGIVGNVIKCTTPIAIGPIKKVCIGIGSFVVSNMVGDKAVEYAEEKIDGAIDQVKKMVKDEEI
jgi:hypothetical protein